MEGGEEEPSTLGKVWYYAWEYGLEVVPVAAPTRGFLRAYDEGSTLGMGLSAVELGTDLSGIGPLMRGGKLAVKGTVRGIGKVASEVKPLASTAIDVAKTKAGQAYSFAKSKAGDAATWMSETSDSVVGGLAGAANWMYSGAAGFFGRGKRIALNVEGKQFGQKMAQRARELGLDPSNPQVRSQFRSRIQRIFDNADEVRSGVFRGQGPNNTEGPVLFFRRGHDVVFTTPNGEFVTLLIGGINNSRFINGVPLP